MDLSLVSASAVKSYSKFVKVGSPPPSYKEFYFYFNVTWKLAFLKVAKIIELVVRPSSPPLLTNLQLLSLTSSLSERIDFNLESRRRQGWSQLNSEAALGDHNHLHIGKQLMGRESELSRTLSLLSSFL